MISILLAQLAIEPGERVILHDVDWAGFETILGELGEARNTRIAYCEEVLEIMAPSPEHEIEKEALGDFVKLLLEELDIPLEAYGSTTFQLPQSKTAVEPDSCFYIKNCSQMHGKKRIDLDCDPVPDLAIEVDVTSITKLDAYRKLGFPELWRYRNGQLKLDVLQNGEYIEVQSSSIFPDWAIPEIMTKFSLMLITEGRYATMKALRSWVRLRIAEQN